MMVVSTRTASQREYWPVTYAVIPAKAFHGAKQRLATFLTPQERFALARAMLTDTLTACCQASGLEGVGVVTCDRDVADVVKNCRQKFSGNHKPRGTAMPSPLRCTPVSSAVSRRC